MRPLAATHSASKLVEIAAEYELFGLPVATGATGISLFTNESVCAIELPAELSIEVRAYLTANAILGPVVALPTVPGVELHIAAGLDKAPLALEALRELGIKVYSNGDVVPLPPTRFLPGEATWAVKLDEAKWVPPVVAISAAMRAVASHRSASRHAS